MKKSEVLQEIKKTARELGEVLYKMDVRDIPYDKERYHNYCGQIEAYEKCLNMVIGMLNAK